MSVRSPEAPGGAGDAAGDAEARTAPACRGDRGLAAQRTDALRSRPPKGVYYASFLNFPKHTPSVSH